jgi:hypothetical protein
LAKREQEKSSPPNAFTLCFFVPLPKKKKGMAERRQTLIRILRILRCGSHLLGALI